MLRGEPDYGEVVARLKGAQRLEIIRIGPWVMARSRVGSFHAPVARGLLNLGADIAIATGRTEGETRCSLRSSARFFDATKIHLGTKVAAVVLFAAKFSRAALSAVIQGARLGSQSGAKMNYSLRFFEDDSQGARPV